MPVRSYLPYLKRNVLKRQWSQHLQSRKIAIFINVGEIDQRRTPTNRTRFRWHYLCIHYMIQQYDIERSLCRI